MIDATPVCGSSSFEEIAASINERRTGTPTFTADEVLAELGTKR